MNDFPIGVLDSGVGGASILKEIVRILPNEKFVYLVDTLNMPYGNKSNRRIFKIVLKNSLSLIEKHNIKMLVIACNTASTVCSIKLRKVLKIPIICIEPPIKLAIECGYKRILILATKRTLKSNKTIKRSIKKIKIKNRGKLNKNKIKIRKLAIKSLASEIDKNFNNFDSLQPLLNKRLEKFANCDAVISGCTHYNFIKKQIQKSLPNAKLISCEGAVAKRVKYVLERDNIKASLLTSSRKRYKNILILTKTNFKLKNYIKNYLNF